MNSVKVNERDYVCPEIDHVIACERRLAIAASSSLDCKQYASGSTNWRKIEILKPLRLPETSVRILICPTIGHLLYNHWTGLVDWTG